MDAEAMFGKQLLSGDGTVDTASKFGDQIELIGIYFSAHWCPPCRGFTPVLKDFYEEVNKDKQRCEIVFVSSDRSDTDMKDYFSEMPWLALPFDSELKNTLKGAHGVSGIPKLVFLGKDGKVRFDDGRGMVTSKGPSSFPWN